MTQSTPPKPLTAEEMKAIEENNKLLAIFSKFLESLDAANPGVELPSQLLYSAFVLGAASVASANQSTQVSVAKDIHEMKRVLQTYMMVDQQGQQP